MATTCEVDECPKPPQKYRRLCSMHRARKARTGDVGESASRNLHTLSSVEPETETGECVTCGKVKIYWRNTGQWEGWACLPSRQKRQRNSRHVLLYGKTTEQFETLLKKQNYKCLLCTNPITIETAHVDHDHRCCPDSTTCGNCFRGLLCSNCNKGLGLFVDNITTLKRAIKYLEYYNGSSN